MGHQISVSRIKLPVKHLKMAKGFQEHNHTRKLSKYIRWPQHIAIFHG
uniref:Uncharacterized protein n=1 Tax=Arundo donax TaxID=35708 RepID=A0A0A9AMU0_ARUDO